MKGIELDSSTSLPSVIARKRMTKSAPNHNFRIRERGMAWRLRHAGSTPAIHRPPIDQ